MFQAPVKHPWMDDAACAAPGIDPDMWFPSLHVSHAAEVEAAIAICAACPVKAECLAHAFTEPHLSYGIWAGLTGDEIRAMRRKARRTA
jgi:WhiB family redox-sensing transcriptional regulator